MVEEVDKRIEYEDEFDGHIEDERYAEGVAGEMDDFIVNDMEESDHLEDEEEAFERQQRKRALARKKENDERFEFPELFNCMHKYQEPGLEFAKFVCEHIFGIESQFYKETIGLRKNLLNKLGRKEFAPETRQGLEPALVMVMPDIICHSCTTSRDIDVCRDPLLN